MKAVSAVAAFVGGASITGTLAACYGSPCAESEASCPDYIPRCSEVSQQASVDDADGDGYCKSWDCDEKDPKINKAASDIPGDGIDQNCDGVDQRK
ncbi:MAG TPA: putative metal-binding motif-containing protein [Polyangia bacterium]